MTTFQCKNHWVKYFVNEKRSLLTASTYFCFQKLWDVFFHDELFWRKQCHWKTMSLEWITFCSLTKRIMFSDDCTMHVTLVSYITWEVSLFGVFLVRLFPHLDWIRKCTPYFSYSVQMRKNPDQKAPNTDTFHEVTFDKEFRTYCKSISKET